MRKLAMAAVLAVLALCGGCVMSEARLAEPQPGPAWDSLRGVHEIRVLAVTLPADLVNAKGPEVERFRKEWPMAGARYVADGITEKSGGRVSAVVATEKPSVGVYAEVEIKYLDMGTGDRTVLNSTGSRAGWSRVQAVIRLIDAKDGGLCASVDADQSSGTGDMFETDMKDIGRQLGAWLDQR